MLCLQRGLVAPLGFRGDHFLNRLLLLFLQPGQFLLNLGFRFVEGNVQLILADNAQLYFLAAAGLLQDCYVVKIVGTCLQGKDVPFLELQFSERPAPANINLLGSRTQRRKGDAARFLARALPGVLQIYRAQRIHGIGRLYVNRDFRVGQNIKAILAARRALQMNHRGWIQLRADVDEPDIADSQLVLKMQGKAAAQASAELQLENLTVAR